jgi:hypothetical protein
MNIYGENILCSLEAVTACFSEVSSSREEEPHAIGANPPAALRH